MTLGPDFHGSRILSRPVRVHWAGWTTTTYELQQAGWELSANQDVGSRRMQIVIRNEQLGMIGQTSPIDFDYLSALHDHRFELPTVAQVRCLGRQIVIQNHGPMTFEPFRPIDAAPQLCPVEMRDLADLAHFAPAPLVRTQAIVLPEEDVDSLLARILEKQACAKTDYFRDLVSREGAAIPAHRFHAQIISLPRAA